ncbi:MAG: thioredoxin-disulfide reductase [bacterium]|nr:thioredoxin-disulfide reductase [bacterium]
MIKSKKETPVSIYDVIIIGAGPSGLTAAIYTSRARLKTLLLEGLSVSSQALVTDKIENYPGFPEGINGFDLIDKFKKQAKLFGAEFAAEDVNNIHVSKQQNINNIWQVEVKDKTYHSLSVIIASGARFRTLGIEGEKRLLGKGVSYCAVCDGAFFKDKDVVVVGGGDASAEEALFLTRFAKKITMVHRRDRLRAAKILQERIFSNKKISIVWNSVINEILGETKVRGVRITDLKAKKETDISCDGVFIFVGLVPNTNFVKDIIKLDENGYVIVDSKMRASRDGIFACGDCRQTILRQVVTACGDGAFAAFSAQQYVEDLKGTAYK